MKTIPILLAVLVATGVAGAQAPQKLSPAESASSFKVADDLRFDQVLAEPQVKQPIAMTFDERGRLWVVQYIQYPQPAGLKVVSRDQYWRVVYDKVPLPPPNHVRGMDRITIHEDTTGTGVFDKHTVFLDGLNIVTSIAHGKGGVWALNPPYLLFYPAKDDKPGEPVVHLQGFGIEDTHSCANSLRWGPDGWLYGTHGSTVSSKVTRPGDKAKPVQMIGQHVWRYHPEKKTFEIFAEGGGNAFGVEIDDAGRIFSGHNGGDTRGFHYVQGGSYRKGFEKHGVLANPYSFGFFEAMKHNKAQRFSHTFVVNESDALGKQYRGKMFAVEPIQGRIMLAEMKPDRSSFETKDVGPVVSSSDGWFRPVDIKMAPDGSLFVADFYEAQIGHLKHNDGVVDRESGRIYRLAAKDAKYRRAPDLGKKTSKELVECLKSESRWERQTAARLLGDRGKLLEEMGTMLGANTGQAALEALWAAHRSQASGFDPWFAEQVFVTHSNPAVRAWAVRLVADRGTLGEEFVQTLVDNASKEPDVQVRVQMAASARRLPAAEALPIVKAMLRRDDDAADIHVPMLLWWALEANCESSRAKVVHLFRDQELWRAKIVEQTILPRLIKRFAMAGTQKDYQTCVQLFRLAPEKKHGAILLKGFEEAFKGRSIAGLPDELLAEIAKLGGASTAFGVRQGDADAIAKGLQRIGDPKTPATERIELIEIFGEAKRPQCVPALLKTLHANEPDAIHVAALGALQAYPDDAIAAAIVERLPSLSPGVREVAESALASRREWSKQLALAVDGGKIAPASIATATVKKLLLHRDQKTADLVRKHWGDVKGLTTAQMLKEVDRLVAVVGDGKADPYAGKKLYVAKCAACHVLHSQGGSVGPDLTPFKRDDVANLLLHVVNPSAEIREGFESSVVVTESGRTLTGIVVEKDARVVVLRTAEGQRIVLPKDDVESINVTGLSLMPEGLLQGMSDREVRDLFGYLRSGQPLFERK